MALSQNQINFQPGLSSPNSQYSAVAQSTNAPQGYMAAILN
jgi:hypothetical protein